MRHVDSARFEQVVSDHIRQIADISKLIDGLLELFEKDVKNAYDQSRVALLNEAVDRKEDLIITVADVLNVPGLSERDLCKGRHELMQLLNKQKQDKVRIANLKLGADLMKGMPKPSSIALQ